MNEETKDRFEKLEADIRASVKREQERGFKIGSGNYRTAGGTYECPLTAFYWDHHPPEDPSWRVRDGRALHRTASDFINYADNRAGYSGFARYFVEGFDGTAFDPPRDVSESEKEAAMVSHTMGARLRGDLKPVAIGVAKLTIAIVTAPVKSE